MQTRTYGDLFSLTSNMIGAVTLAADEQTQLASFLDRRFFEAFQTSQMWPRYLISSEPRTITPHQTIPTSEDGFYIYGAGKAEVNGLYQYGPEYSNHNSYVLNGNSLSFEVTAENLSNPDILGTYKLDASYSLSGNTYNRGVWVNQTNGNVAFARYSHAGTEQWRLVLLDGFPLTGFNSSTFFPWQASWGIDLTISNAPSVAYNIERNALNNHWELMQQDADGTATVLYKDGNGNIPSETAWEIVNARNPAPTVHDLDNIGEFVRIHRNQAFLNNSSLEYDFFVDQNGATILNIANTSDGIAYVTYKQEFTPFGVTTEYYNDDTDVPAEFFHFLAHAAYADFLRVQNKQQEAIAEEQVAFNYLALELEKVDIKMNNTTVNKRFSTHGNRQAR